MAYKSPRAIHPRRLLDITWGSVLNGTKTKVQKLNLGRSIRNGITVSDFNEKIRTASPNIYVVDPGNVAKIVFDAFNLHSTHNIKDLEDLIVRTLKARVNSTITMTQLVNLAEKIHSKMVADLTRATEQKMTYLTFRRVAAGAGAELRRSLNIHKVTEIVDPQNFINNPEGKLAYLSYSFDRLKIELNAIITSAVGGFAKKAKSIPSNFQIGSIVDSGHVGLYSGKDFVGINMPAQIIHATIGQKFDQVEEALGSIDTHIEYGIKLNEKFTSSGVLLDLGFQFTVAMPSALNRSLWSDKESKALLEHVKLATKNELTEVFKSKIPDEALIDLISDSLIDKGVRASPTVIEFIVSSITDTLEGKSTKSYIGSKVMLGQKTLGKVLSSKTGKSSKPKKSTVNIPKIRAKSGKFASLISIQSLINQALATKIKQNMGTPALNNRTGRFAESAKVENMSQSREGMITAFYQWMRYPYATFSEGGKQHTRAREPKTLISRSIREIASTIVGNRLRAVSL